MNDDHGGGNGQLHSAWYMRGTHGWTLYTYTLSAKGTGGERSYTDLDFVTTVATTNISNQIILHFSCFVPPYFATAQHRCPSYIFLCDSPCTKRHSSSVFIYIPNSIWVNFFCDSRPEVANAFARV
jgi:hypothetical protein